MNPKILVLTYLLFIISFLGQSQVTNFKEKFELPIDVKETSGLLFLDGKIITHNDSGDNANLYEIDSLSGNLLRTISISNATNIDWEDITEDENHIYIADIGNNYGNRTNLKIYKILKTDFKNNTSVSAEIISYSYEDQTDFSNNPYNTNFDAEAVVVYGNNILIFTKNWINAQTNVYKIPRTTGNYIATKVSSANVKGLITGATLQNDNFILCGYNSDRNPFLIFISFNRESGDNIFNNGFEKHILINEISKGSQVEGITAYDLGKFYLSREKNSSLSQKLFEFTDNRFYLLSIKNNIFLDFKINPNPINNSFYISSKKRIKKIVLYNTLGKKVLEQKIPEKEINISHLSKGIYTVRVAFDHKFNLTKKIIKL